MANPTYAVYARPLDLNLYLGHSTGHVDEELMLDLCVWARAQIDRITRRHFWPEVATRTYDFKDDYELTLDDDLISLTTLTNGDSSEISSSDYYLYPNSGPPYAWIELDEGAATIFDYSTTRQQCISVAGVWGWNEYTVSSGATVSTSYTADATSLVPSDASVFAVGDLLKIGSDYLYVTANDGTTLTVQPGVNGATSASHTSSTAIYFVRFPDEITDIATRLAAWRYKQKDAPFETSANPMMGVVVVPARLPPDIERDLEAWTRRKVL